MSHLDRAGATIHSLTDIFSFGHTRLVDTTTFSALADPSRLAIVELLRGGPASVGEIAERLDLRQPQASKHLRVLNEAGLVEVRALAQRRIYALRAPGFEELEHWLDDFRAAWEPRLDSLEQYVQTLKRKDRP